MASRGWERDADLARRDTDSTSTAAVDDASATQDAGEAADGTAAPVATQKRRRNLLRESHLLSAEGFKKIHRTFPYQVSADVTGREAQALASLVKMYKQWAFDLYPGLNFEDFVERAETLGKSHEVQGLMIDLRDKEKMKAVKKRRIEEKESEPSDSEEEAML